MFNFAGLLHPLLQEGNPHDAPVSVFAVDTSSFDAQTVHTSKVQITPPKFNWSVEHVMYFCHIMALYNKEDVLLSKVF